MSTAGERTVNDDRLRAADVVVVGSLNVDLAVYAARLPRAGETLIGDRAKTDDGGKGGNQAVAAARMGARVAMIGRVGRDAHGRRLLEAMRLEGVDAGLIGVDPSLPTGVAAIVVAANGENAIVVVPGANMGLEMPKIGSATPPFAGARIVVVQLEVPWATAAAALAMGRKAGATTLLNAAPASVLSSEQLGDVDWLIVNASEAALMGGIAVDDIAGARAAASALAALGPAHVVVTLGSAGLVHASPHGIVHAEAFAVTPVDSTGAGDTFVGTLAACLAAGLPASTALCWGQAAAALAVEQAGSQSAMPRRADVLARWGAPSLAPPVPQGAT